MHVPKHLLLVAEPCQPFSLLTPQEFLGPFLHHCEWGSMVEKVCFEDQHPGTRADIFKRGFDTIFTEADRRAIPFGRSTLLGK
jgi:hypothetical protein